MSWDENCIRCGGTDGQRRGSDYAGGRHYVHRFMEDCVIELGKRLTELEKKLADERSDV